MSNHIYIHSYICVFFKYEKTWVGLDRPGVSVEDDSRYGGRGLEGMDSEILTTFSSAVVIHHSARRVIGVSCCLCHTTRYRDRFKFLNLLIRVRLRFGNLGSV